MGKLLRILVVVLLVVSIVALVLAHSLFSRREVVRGRVLTMQRNIIRLARTIESASPETPAVPPSFPEKDISPATADPEPNPRRAQFWSNYRVELESLDQPILDLSNRRRELMSYYRTDPATGRPVLDPDTGAPYLDGPGTMQGVFDELLTRAGEQYNLLTATRQQMRLVREELVATIQELNTTKNELRTEKGNVQRVEAEKTQLQRDAEAARRDLQLAQERSRELDRRVGDLEQEKLVLVQEKDTLTVRHQDQVELIAGLRAQIEDLRRIDGRGDVVAVGEGVAPGVARVDIGTGEKGRIVSVDQKHLFVVIELDDVFVEELLGAAQNNRLPLLELMVMRPDGEKGRFITKIRLAQLRQDQNLAIADIMPDWQQEGIRVGDKVYYQ